MMDLADKRLKTPLIWAKASILKRNKKTLMTKRLTNSLSLIPARVPIKSLQLQALTLVNLAWISRAHRWTTNRTI